jgi:hypothetical protein
LVHILQQIKKGISETEHAFSYSSLSQLKWRLESQLGYHDMILVKSHTGAVMMLGKGVMHNQLQENKKMNVRSSTEGELVAVDNAATIILWAKLFLEAQGYDVKKNIVYQDNKRAISLETNGKKSSGKRTRALNIRYFFITDQVEKGNTQIEHCGTNDKA